MVNDRAAQVDEGQSEDKSSGILIGVHQVVSGCIIWIKHSKSISMGVWSEDYGQT